MQANQALLDIMPESYVIVKPDLSPGMCSYGGAGFVTDVNGDGVLWTFTVKYDKSGSSRGKTEAGIQYSHVTETLSLCVTVEHQKLLTMYCSRLPRGRSSKESKKYLLPVLHVVEIRVGEPKTLGLQNMGAGMRTLRISIVKTQKSCWDFFQGSRQRSLLLVHQRLGMTKEDATDVFQSAEKKPTLTLSLILLKLGALARTSPCSI
jgi:hypothetical protein